mmetsp:Transcript_33118/g.83501  ORF Transcript_33118/g.83501 Transcript_33118/m.83501 type:complete len:244 (+) Transcript_33118:4152-4883(+)
MATSALTPPRPALSGWCTSACCRYAFLMSVAPAEASTPRSLYQFTGRLFLTRAITVASFERTCVSSLLSRGSSSIVLYAATASVSMSSSVYSVASRLCALTKVGTMATAVPADDKASAYLPRACSHAQMLDRKSPSSIGAPADLINASVYMPNASWCLPWKKAPRPSSLHLLILEALSKSVRRPSGSGTAASSLILSSPSASSSPPSLSLACLASSPSLVSSAPRFFSIAALNVGTICSRPTS